MPNVPIASNFANGLARGVSLSGTRLAGPASGVSRAFLVHFPMVLGILRTGSHAAAFLGATMTRRPFVARTSLALAAATALLDSAPDRFGAQRETGSARFR